MDLRIRENGSTMGDTTHADKTVIMLSGKMRSGKDTFAAMLVDRLSKSGKRVTKVSFADKLKTLCQETLGPVLTLIENLYGIKIQGDFRENKSPIHRMILQNVGTEIVRKIDDMHWTRRVSDSISNDPFQIFVITDWRFPNELTGLTRNLDIKRIITVFVERPLPKDDAHGHASERSLDEGDSEEVIRNHGTLEELGEKVDLFIQKYGLA